MIVIGTDVVESYFADHAGHKGTKSARSQYEAWREIVARAEWRTPEEVKTSYPKASILKAGRVVFNVKPKRLSIDRPSAIPGGRLGDQVLWDAYRI